MEFCERPCSVEYFSKLVLFCENEREVRKTIANNFLQISKINLAIIIRTTNEILLNKYQNPPETICSIFQYLSLILNFLYIIIDKKDVVVMKMS